MSRRARSLQTKLSSQVPAKRTKLWDRARKGEEQAVIFYLNNSRQKTDALEASHFHFMTLYLIILNEKALPREQALNL